MDDTSHRLYLSALSRMTPEARLMKAFELTEFCRALFLHGLRRRFPELDEAALRKLMLQRLELCHNRNY